MKLNNSSPKKIKQPTFFAFAFFLALSLPIISIIGQTTELPLIFRMNCGGNSVTINDRVYVEDVFSVGGKEFSNTNIATIQNTNDDDVYKTERSGDGGFQYKIPISNGTFTLKLHFAEIFWGATNGGDGANGKRVFNIEVEGEDIINDFDIFKEVGAEYAIIKESIVTVTDNELSLNFSASVDQAKLSAIEIFGNGSITEPLSDICDWTTLTSSANEKVESQSAKVNGKLYVFAGFLADLKITGATEIYDPSLNSWSIGANMPSPVTHMGTVVDGDDVWIIGGFTGNHPGVSSDLVQVYNTTTNTWRSELKIPIPTGSLAAAINGRKIHIFGGLKSDRRTDIDEHYILDLNNKSAGWVAAAAMPEARNHHSAAAVLGKVYAIGGQRGHDSGTDDQKFLHEYDPTTDTWTRKADLPTGRSHFEPGTLVYNDKIIIVGGRNGGFFFKDITQYDPETDTWSEICELPSKNLAPSAKEFEGRLIVANGGINGTCCPSDTTLAMDLPNDSTLSISDFRKPSKSISLYPNPAVNFVEFQTTESITKISIEIYTTLGQLVFKEETLSTSKKLNLSALSKGLYLVKIVAVNSDSDPIIEKLILR